MNKNKWPDSADSTRSSAIAPDHNEAKTSTRSQIDLPADDDNIADTAIGETLPVADGKSQTESHDKFTGPDLRRDPLEEYNELTATDWEEAMPESAPPPSPTAASETLDPATLVEVNSESDFSPLTVEEVQQLRRARVTDARIAEIAAARKSKSAAAIDTRPNLATVIADKKDWLLEQTGGKPLLSAKVVAKLMTEAGFYPEVRRCNGYGDRLGNHGHHLPSIVVHCARRYDIGFIGKSETEKEKRQQELDHSLFDVVNEQVAVLNPTAAPL